MAYDSYVEYNGTGSKTDFAITFNYLSQTVVLPPSTPAGIKVYVSDVQQTTGYTITGSNIVFDTAPASGTKNVIIKRVTPRGHGDRLVNFAAGATLSAADLETSQLQNLYIAQEAWEQGSEDSVVTTSTTSIDADSITANELAPDSVGDSELKDDAIAIANMQDDSVGEDQIVDDSVTFAKLKETNFVTGVFGAAADTFLRFDRSTGHIVDPLTEDSQVKVADITDFQSSVNAKALSDFTGTIAGAGVPMQDKKITGLATPTADTDAATKGYVDSILPLKTAILSGTIGATLMFPHPDGAPDDDAVDIVTMISSTLPAGASEVLSIYWNVQLNSVTGNFSSNDDPQTVVAKLVIGGTTVSTSANVLELTGSDTPNDVLDANPDVTTVVHPYIISGVDGAAMTVKLHFSDTSGDDEDTDRYSITTGSAQVRIIYV